jgi:hypothetical protein
MVLVLTFTELILHWMLYWTIEDLSRFCRRAADASSFTPDRRPFSFFFGCKQRLPSRYPYDSPLYIKKI